MKQLLLAVLLSISFSSFAYEDYDTEKLKFHPADSRWGRPDAYKFITNEYDVGAFILDKNDIPYIQQKIKEAYQNDSYLRILERGCIFRNSESVRRIVVVGNKNPRLVKEREERAKEALKRRKKQEKENEIQRKKQKIKDAAIPYYLENVKLMKGGFCSSPRVTLRGRHIRIFSITQKLYEKFFKLMEQAEDYDQLLINTDRLSQHSHNKLVSIDQIVWLKKS